MRRSHSARIHQYFFRPHMNPRILFPCVAAATALLAVTAAHAADMFPFVLPWDDATPGVTNLSNWLDQPAGNAGFVAARDGHLYAGPKRIRFFGVNLAFGGNFPTHADAEKVAARMAKFGINCVRFHHMDTSTAPAGILKNDKRTLDPESLDRLDYFIAQLKKNGVYANLNLHVGLEYPGFKKWEGGAGYFKGVDNFFTPMIAQQRDYARALLTHENSYTGKPYIDEPAVAFIEINNENGLIMEWNNGSLDAMPDPFAAEFREQWNAWLVRKYGAYAQLAAAWNQGAEPLGDEMLKPAHEAWYLEQHEGARASVDYAPGDAETGEITHIHVTEPGREGWHVQMTQSGLKFAAEKTYTIHLRAKASAPRKISLGLSQAHAPWKGLGNREVSLTTEWQDIQFSVPVSTGDDQARFSLSNLATSVGDIWLAGISLRPGGIIALNEGETLGQIPFFTKKAIGGRTLVAQRDWNEFLVDTETKYWTGMRQFIREELHAHSLVLGSASGFSPWLAQSKLDVVDAHSYWQHPHFPHRQWDMNDWTVKNVSMAGAPDGGTLPGLALRRVAGKPFIVTEYNAASPNSYSSEAFLEVCAVAALQDWDGLFVFAYSHRLNDWDTKHMTSFFDIDQHPTKMATLPAALALFMHGDVQPPARPAIAETTPAAALESVRTGGSWVDARAYGIPALDTFRRPIAMRIGPEKKWNEPAADDSKVITSDNGELKWDTAGHRMLIASPRSVGVVGSVKPGEVIELGEVRIIPGATLQNWATIDATVREGDDFKTARHILITATGMNENTGMHWKDAEKTSVTTWGKGPSLVEGINAKIILPAIKGAKAWALDERGQRKNEVPLVQTDAGTQLEISSEHGTLWWEIAVP